MKDYSKPMEGFFSIKTIYEDGSFDIYEEKNKIMDDGRINMAKLMASGETFSINYFRIGNMGTENGSLTTPKDFSSQRTKLFSQEDPDGKWLMLAAPVVDVGSTTATITTEGFFNDADKDVGDDASNTSITTTIENNKVTYTVSFPAKSGVPDGDNLISYTEAGLYIGDSIFSMKTFPARVKDYNVSFEITWSITF